MTPEHFKTLRARLGLTAQALGRIPGLRNVVTDRTVRRWESGDVSLPADAISALLALDAFVEQRVREATRVVNAQAATRGAPQAVELVRYRDDQALARVHPDFPGGNAVHNALIDRCREALEARGIAVTIRGSE
ncbi:hypothetical protein C7S18_23745 (plasmid) [Ahniella affigens]|uniref:Uncharacterized protein n=1 Tax=Ahniella affigens TaxID=2021234 RepID=A0A2P1PZN9_9GAMM|nr:hypothetical protein [Ahniella affigens]AVQ00314.1 hypothetical protein C7S18_23745 [Ahniella affigens]